MSTGRSGLGVEMQVEGAGIVDTIDARYRWCVYPQPLRMVPTKGSQQPHFPETGSWPRTAAWPRGTQTHPWEQPKVDDRRGEYETTATLSQGGMALWCQHVPELPMASG